MFWIKVFYNNSCSFIFAYIEDNYVQIPVTMILVEMDNILDISLNVKIFFYIILHLN